jgi:hypothetical protein
MDENKIEELNANLDALVRTLDATNEIFVNTYNMLVKIDTLGFEIRLREEDMENIADHLAEKLKEILKESDTNDE